MECQHCANALLSYIQTDLEVEAKQNTNPRAPSHVIVSVYDKYECPECGTQLQTKTAKTYVPQN